MLFVALSSSNHRSVTRYCDDDEQSRQKIAGERNDEMKKYNECIIILNRTRIIGYTPNTFLFIVVEQITKEWFMNNGAHNEDW